VFFFFLEIDSYISTGTNFVAKIQFFQKNGHTRANLQTAYII